MSAQSCTGQLPGDLSSQARAAQHETDQVTISVIEAELDQAERLQPDSPMLKIWGTRLAAWDGGLPSDVDASSSDASDGGGD